MWCRTWSAVPAAMPSPMPMSAKAAFTLYAWPAHCTRVTQRQRTTTTRGMCTLIAPVSSALEPVWCASGEHCLQQGRHERYTSEGEEEVPVHTVLGHMSLRTQSPCREEVMLLPPPPANSTLLPSAATQQQMYLVVGSCIDSNPYDAKHKHW